MNGRIVQTGDKQLAIDLDNSGYRQLQEAAQ
jgi:Fe-S cluster assembly ATPase SufC